MSLRIMTDVFYESEALGTDRLVLLALADHANDECWSGWPSVSRLALKARVSERTVQRCLRRLLDGGHIAVVPEDEDDRDRKARYRTTRYRVLQPWRERPGPQGCQSVTPASTTRERPGRQGRHSVTPAATTRSRGDISGFSGVTPVTPEPRTQPSGKTPPTPLRGERAGSGDPGTAADVDVGAFLDAFPKRRGRIVGRAKAAQRWERLTPAERAAAVAAAGHYAAYCAAADRLPKDPGPWLRARLWEDFADPPVPEAPPGPGLRLVSAEAAARRRQGEACPSCDDSTWAEVPIAAGSDEVVVTRCPACWDADDG